MQGRQSSALSKQYTLNCPQAPRIARIKHEWMSRCINVRGAPALIEKGFQVILCNPKKHEAISKVGRSSVGWNGAVWWVNSVVAPIWQPSGGGLQTPSPAGTQHWPPPPLPPNLSDSIWPSVLYRSTPDPCSTFQHLLIGFMCTALPQKDNLLQMNKLDFKEGKQLYV